MKNNILLIIISLSSMLVASEIENKQISLKITKLLPVLQQTVIDYLGCDWQLVGTLIGHTGTISIISISNDGSILTSASDDQTVKIWDTSNCSCTKTLNFNDNKLINFNDLKIKESFLLDRVYGEMDFIDYIAISQDKNYIAILHNMHHFSFYNIKEDRFLLENINLDNLSLKYLYLTNSEYTKKSLENPLWGVLPQLNFISISPNNKFLLYYSNYLTFILDLDALNVIKQFGQDEINKIREINSDDNLFKHICESLKIDYWDPELRIYHKARQRFKSNNMLGYFGDCPILGINFSIRKKGSSSETLNIQEPKVKATIFSANDKYLAYAAGNDIKIYENLNQRLLE